ncbi:MAG: DUF1659 domain-containing protein [Syntrophomonas sp.]|uniref:DUF1659 domain-containing protein n=1 Tax=Syntrophomonas sp. TaxID=2053627 RepID=UPI002634D3E6|nr:DUF1659 domain-containing protein [Syntrophomonas sp.]MDD2509902.1 DUF1659 domain-containing protein [Syntrophomonas sp.]MDD3878971.1 DUF1659 domain-containing protein [Syntrophomonas sp.]MDD4626714.1 DUF1659 domain-containing protein [Syntrophomonas sp.]
MAVVSTPLGSELALVMDNGGGKSITRRYDKVKSAATDADVYAVGTGISGLQEKTLLAVQRRDSKELENE